MPRTLFVVATLLTFANPSLGERRPLPVLDAPQPTHEARHRPTIRIFLTGDSASVASVTGIIAQEGVIEVSDRVDTTYSLTLTHPGTQKPIALSVRLLESEHVIPEETIRIWELV